MCDCFAQAFYSSDMNTLLGVDQRNKGDYIYSSLLSMDEWLKTKQHWETPTKPGQQDLC